MKTKDQGTAWLRANGWIHFGRRWIDPNAEQQATTKQGDKA